MVTPAIIATALGGGAAGPPYALLQDGGNVLKELGTAANRYGVPVGSIVHTEAAPGSVSSLSYELEDPSKAITMRRGIEVRLNDLADDRPLFYGWVQTWRVRPWGLGRVWLVKCIGAEVLLDWLIVPSLTIPAGTRTNAAIQSAAGNAIGVGVPLRAFAQPGLGGFAGDQDTPIPSYANVTSTLTLAYDVVITAQTLRQAIDKIREASVLTFDTFSPGDVVVGQPTVDPYLGLRVPAKDSIPTDYATLTVTDTTAGTNVAKSLNHGGDGSGIPSGVWVQGGNAAGTGLVTVGDGIPGPVHVLNDSSILTTTARQAAGIAYLRERTALPERGEFDLTDHTISTNVRPGSQLDLTDAETGATGSYRIASITRTFTGTRESWHIAYGAARPSLARAVRRLTRTVLS